jgi:hypothetical protein
MGSSTLLIFSQIGWNCQFHHVVQHRDSSSVHVSVGLSLVEHSIMGTEPPMTADFVALVNGTLKRCLFVNFADVLV